MKLRRPGLRLRTGLGRLLAIGLGMAVLTAAGALQVHNRYETVRLGYAIDNARFEARTLLEESKRLRLTLAAWKDPEHVRRLATERLGMKETDSSSELVVPGGDLAPALPVPAAPPAQGDEP